MRIAYLVHASGGSASGVFHKIMSHARTWQAMGHDARLFALTRDDPSVWISALQDSVVRRHSGVGTRAPAMVHLVRAIRAFEPDILYIRYQPFHPSMLGLPRRARTAIEINTNDLHEYQLGSKRRARYNALTRGLLLRQAHALVFVSSELSQSQAFARFDVRREVITNGIDLSAYPVLAPPSEGPPTLVMVANPAGLSWQGVDHLLRLAELRPSWRVEIVGLERGRGPSPANVRWHGVRERPDVLGILGTADVGVSALALYRNAMEEASTLKVREYLAVGLPVLLAHHDPDADTLDDLVLHIPNSPSNVEDALDEIDRFVVSARGRRVPRALIGHIDVPYKEQQRLALFADLLQA
jgi:glycosyltransferase involved in cell wall biosynthesis